MQEGFEPFASHVGRRVIPTGAWQRIAGVTLDIIGVLALFAIDPTTNAGTVAVVSFVIGNSLLTWGFLLKYLSALEEKTSLIIVGLELERAGDV